MLHGLFTDILQKIYGKKGVLKMDEIKSENYFWLEDGRSIKNLEDLKFALENIDDELFQKHVNNEKNDFANWIEHALQLPELANNMRKTKSKEIMLLKIKDWLVAEKLKGPETKSDEKISKEPYEGCHTLPHPPREQKPPEIHPIHEHIERKLIIKEFLYGMFLGLVLGIILMQIIANVI